MTGPEIMAAVMFVLAVFGAITGAFWRMWGLIKEAGDKGDQAQRDLAAHKLHAAETFATKQGMQEQTAQLLRAIEGVVGRIDGLSERLDNIILQRPTGRRTN